MCKCDRVGDPLALGHTRQVESCTVFGTRLGQHLPPRLRHWPWRTASDLSAVCLPFRQEWLLGDSGALGAAWEGGEYLRA